VIECIDVSFLQRVNLRSKIEEEEKEKQQKLAQE
jgi:hypothetical protein